MILTRIEAAKRQLAAGLKLWFDEGDEVSAHTLICSAHQILHDLNRKAHGKPMLFDSEYWRPEKKKEVVSALKASMNFFKHADERKGKPSDTLDFSPESSEFFAFFAVELLATLGQSLGPMELAFRHWLLIHRTDLLTDAAQERVAQLVPVEAIEAARKLDRPQFLKRLIDLGVIK